MPRRPSPLRWSGELESRSLLSTSPITFTFNNRTDLGPSVPVYVAMYGQENNVWGEFDLSGTFRAFTNADTTVTTYQLAGPSTAVTFANSSAATRVNAGRVVFGVGSQPVLTVNANNGGVNAPNLGNPSDPNSTVFYDFFEFTERAADGALFINTSTIDQVGFPLTITITPTDPTAPNGVGVDILRQQMFARFNAYIDGIVAQNPAAATFKDLVNPNLVGQGTLAGQTSLYRIIAPKDIVQFGRTVNNQPYSSAIKTYFNPAITTLFATASGLSLQVPNPNFGATTNPVNPNDPQTYTFTGTATTTSALGNDGQMHTYQAIRFDGTVAGQATSFFVYQPFFTTNSTGASLPPPMQWITNPTESPGQMVSGCDGVFNDNLGQFPGSAPNDSIGSLNNLKSNLLANIENQLVSALNRGVAGLPTSDWQNPALYYAPTSLANFYSGFLHLPDVSIDGKAYGFPYDDQAGQSSTMATDNPTAVNVILGAWFKASQGSGRASGLPGALVVSGPAGAVMYNPDPLSGNYGAGAAVAAPAGMAGPVRYALADVTGDGVLDRVAAAGPGGPPLVVVVDGKTGAEVARFLAFEAGFAGGVNVAAGDFDRDGKAEIVATADDGGGAVVAVFNGAGRELVRFLGIQDAGFRGGARAAVGDVTGDGVPEVIVTAGKFGGPRVTVWNGVGLMTGAVLTAPLANFFAFDEGLRDGAFVAAGDATGDGRADLAFGAGAGGAPRVLILDGAKLLAGGPAEVASFFAGDPAGRGGAELTQRNLDADGFADVVVADRAGRRVRVYDGAALRAGAAKEEQALDPFGGDVLTGAFVG
jgi:hypothetical protein